VATRVGPSTAEPGDARPLVGDHDLEELGCGATFHAEIHLAGPGVAEGVARDLRDGGGDAGLIPRLEAKEAGDLARALPGEDDVVLQFQRHGQDAQAHPEARLATTTVASSRPRVKSR